MTHAIIWGTFALGAGLIIVGVVALFKNLRGGGGTFKFGPIELSGKGTPIMLVLVGATMVLMTFSWASSREEAQAEREQKVEAVARATEAESQARALESAGREVAQDAADLLDHLQEEVEARRELVSRLPSDVKANLLRTQPDLVNIQEPTVPVHLEEMLRLLRSAERMAEDGATTAPRIPGAPR